MNEEKIISYWSDMYSKPNVFGEGPTKLAIEALELIKKNNSQNILEIGCGQGRDVLFFSKQGYTVDTFDISESAIKFVNETKKSSNMNNIKAIVHNVEEEFPYLDNSFDFIYSNLALQFFSKEILEKIFDNIYKVMKKNSILYFSTKKKGDKYYNFGNKIHEDAYEHKGITRYFYEKNILLPILEKNFQIIKFEDDKHTNPNLTISVWWKILLKKL